jgi:hypothetical protein
MSYNCIKIDDIKYKGFNVYYKKKINMDIRLARKFDSDYIYYQKIPDNNVSSNFKMKLLGKFISRSKKNLGTYSYDADYDVYQFENDYVFCDQHDTIYCTDITNEDLTAENMILIEDLYYQDHLVYYLPF